MSEPPYAIAWSPGARRSLTRLPEKVATAVVELVYGPISQEPRRVGKPLQPGLTGLWSARRGAYRVLYRLDDDARRVDVVTVQHRSDAYRRS